MPHDEVEVQLLRLVADLEGAAVSDAATGKVRQKLRQVDCTLGGFVRIEALALLVHKGRGVDARLQQR